MSRDVLYPDPTIIYSQLNKLLPSLLTTSLNLMSFHVFELHCFVQSLVGSYVC